MNAYASPNFADRILFLPKFVKNLPTSFGHSGSILMTLSGFFVGRRAWLAQHK